MGVKDLWGILEPVRETVMLDSLAGSSVAIDLGFWLCEMQAAVRNPNVKKIYLRNLFFRISALLRLNIKIIVVCDGEPPQLKQQTMAQRQRARFGREQIDKENNYPAQSRKTKHFGSEKLLKRSKFRSQLKECAEMLSYMGVMVIEVPGEAEAFCSYLNAENVVDGVISDDSDVFLYGAVTVYRNFNLDSKSPTVECYRKDHIEKRLQLNRERLIALALLLGCDYCPTGVPGVGKDQAMKYLRCVDEDESVLDRLKTLSLNDNDKPEATVRLTASVCPNHERDCTGSCSFCCYEKVMHYERNFRRKMAARDQFPVDDIIAEYLINNGSCLNNQGSLLKLKKEDIIWKSPKLMDFCNFMVGVTDWDSQYALAKIIPLMTLYRLRYLCSSNTNSRQSMQALQIKKERTRNGIKCVEVHWTKMACDNISSDGYYVTVEELVVFQAAFPDMVKEFYENLQKAKKHPKLAAKRNCKPLGIPDSGKKQIADSLSATIVETDENSDDRPNCSRSGLFKSPYRANVALLPPIFKTPSLSDLNNSNSLNTKMARSISLIEFVGVYKANKVSNDTNFASSKTISTNLDLLRAEIDDSPPPLSVRLKNRLNLC